MKPRMIRKICVDILIFYIIGNCSAFSYDTKASGRMRTDARGILLLRNMHPARQKCASGRQIKVARMCEAHFCSIKGKFSLWRTLG